MVEIKKEATSTNEVAIVMGSDSDFETLKHAHKIFHDFNIGCDVQVVSAHRTPEHMFSFAKTAHARGLKIIIAGAGGAAHLPGMISALTTLPVLGVPVQSKSLNGLDSLLSIVQMPGGVPTATFAIGPAGARNAALFAMQILALNDPEKGRQLREYREKLRTKVEASQKHIDDALAAVLSS